MTMRTSELMSVVFALMLITLFNCGPRDKNGVTKQSQDYTDKTFESFFNKFGVNSTFQAQRIKYPLPYLSYPDDSDELTTREISLGQWKYRNLIDDSLSIEFEPVIEMKDSLNVVYSQRGIDNGILIMYDFVKEEGKWYLVKMTNASD